MSQYRYVQRYVTIPMADDGKTGLVLPEGERIVSAQFSPIANHNPRALLCVIESVAPQTTMDDILARIRKILAEEAADG